MKKAKYGQFKINNKTVYGSFFHGTSYEGLKSILKSSSLKDLNDPAYLAEEGLEPVIYATLRKSDAETFSGANFFGNIIQLKNYSISPTVIIRFYTNVKPDTIGDDGNWALWSQPEIPIYVSGFDLIQSYTNKKTFDPSVTKRLRLYDPTAFWNEFEK